MFNNAKVGDKFTAMYMHDLEPLEFEVTSIKEKYNIICGVMKTALGGRGYSCCFFQKDGSDTDYGGWRLFPLGTTITINYPEE